MDRDEQIGRPAIGDRDALAEREGPVVGARELHGDPARAELGRDEVRDRQRQLLLVESGALGPGVGTAVAGVEDDDRRCRRCERRSRAHRDRQEAERSRRLHDM